MTSGNEKVDESRYSCLYEQGLLPDNAHEGRLVALSKMKSRETVTVDKIIPIVVNKNFTKIIEKVMMKIIMKNHAKLVSYCYHQTGFKEGHSTLNNLWKATLRLWKADEGVKHIKRWFSL
jgi:hypothetical protein